MRLLEEVDHDGLWSEKGGVLEKQMKMVTSLKIVIKLFLPFSIKI